MTGGEHERYTGLSLVLSAPVVAGALGMEGAVAYLGAGLLSTLFLSPDLDLPDSRSSKRWGPLNWTLWALYRAFHAHRGASHSYLYGPLSRLLFLALPFLLGLTLVGAFLPTPPVEVVKGLLKALKDLPSGVLWGAALGYLVGQWAHLVQDRIPPHRLLG